MKRVLLLLFATIAFACMRPEDSVVICFNKPGVRLHALSSLMQERLRKSIGADGLEYFSYDGVACLEVIKKPRYLTSSIETRLDLLPWFANKRCAKSWESFHRCMNERRNPKDELLYRRLEREFVSKIICEEGQSCEKEYLLWEFYWDTPYSMRLRTKIGKGGFASVAEAKRSLERINQLLKKVLYGARFPVTPQESEGESWYYEKKQRVLEYDFAKKTLKLLQALEQKHLLAGLKKEDQKQLAKSFHPGAFILYIPPECPSPYPYQKGGGWIDVGMAKIEFGECPRVQILK